MTASIRLSVQEDMLPGPSIAEKFAQAETLGLDGLEFWSRDTTVRMADIVQARTLYTPVVSTVCYGRRGRLLDQFRGERERTANEIRQVLTECEAIGARGLVLVPVHDVVSMPDLSPFKTAVELEDELLKLALTELCAVAEPLKVEIYLAPANRYESPYINRLAHAATIVSEVNHPAVRVAANLFHMLMEEDDPFEALREFGDWIGHIHIADSNRRLPGQGILPFEKLAAVLDDINYAGWLTFECGTPGSNAAQANAMREQLPQALEFLAAAGISKS